jgi:hypothetical protein
MSIIVLEQSSGSQTVLRGALGLREGFAGALWETTLMMNFNSTEILNYITSSKEIRYYNNAINLTLLLVKYIYERHLPNKARCRW